MVDRHNQSFFGQSSGMTLISASKSDPFIFIKCIKKKNDGNWEKPSLGEGKTVKCNLDEIVMILEVLKGKRKAWSSYHNFNDSKTSISFKWDEKSEDKMQSAEEIAEIMVENLKAYYKDPEKFWERDERIKSEVVRKILAQRKERERKEQEKDAERTNEKE